MLCLRIAVVAALGVLAPMADVSAAVKETVIHKFVDGTDGATPWDGVLIDTKGNVYGTTQEGGSANEYGTVYMLTAPATTTGIYKESILHRFVGGTKDGRSPIVQLIIDSKGALYGTTQFGGPADAGTVFTLKPPATGSTAWTEKLLYSFKGTTDGETPDGALLADADGDLYGTTASGGKANNGVVFELTPNAAKTAYTQRVVYTFKGGADGSNPESNLLMDAKGQLYGTAARGGTSGNGLVFRLTPNAAKTVWTKTALHLFSGTADGRQPEAGLVMDASGILYGTTFYDNTNLSGAVYRLKPNAAETAYAETILYRFTGDDDGYQPWAGVVLDKSGNLYGATVNNEDPGNGGVFKLTPNAAKSAYKFSIVYAFSNKESGYPYGTPVLDKSGALWGTTQGDDFQTYGSVFKITQ